VLCNRQVCWPVLLVVKHTTCCLQVVKVLLDRGASPSTLNRYASLQYWNVHLQLMSIQVDTYTHYCVSFTHQCRPHSCR
jgi:hypothetical protein